MQLKNAIKKMSKVGEVKIDGMQAWVSNGGSTISVRAQKDWRDETKTEVVSISKTNDVAVENDPINANCYVTFYDNLTQAMRYF
jgi:hypothetical protein